jgi:3-dehydroquinate synthetase
MLFAALVGRQRGHADLVPDLLSLLEWLQPAPLPELEFEVLAPYIARDKKAAGGVARFVLLEALGAPYLAADVSAQEQRSAFTSLKELMA